MGAFDKPDPMKVKTLQDLFAFVHHYHGITRGKTAYISFFKGWHKFIENNPHWEGRGVTYAHLAKLCEWGVKTNKGRVSGTSLLFYWLDQAVKEGVFPDLEEKSESEDLEDQFYSILAIEDDPQWRNYLISTQGKLRQQAIAEWRQEHA